MKKLLFTLSLFISFLSYSQSSKVKNYDCLVLERNGIFFGSNLKNENIGAYKIATLQLDFNQNVFYWMEDNPQPSSGKFTLVNGVLKLIDTNGVVRELSYKQLTPTVILVGTPLKKYYFFARPF